MTQATQDLTSISYLLIGSGRVARHFAHYFHLLDIPIQTWDRSQDPLALARKVSDASHILMAISDEALNGFYRQKLAGHDKVIVHFSGAHHIPGTIAAHPLMSFGPELYDLKRYQSIHFAITGTPELRHALPGLKNSYSLLAAEDKALYHALCVTGGNFVTLLISQMIQGLAKMHIPPEATQTYSQTILENVYLNPTTALTGPLARRDVTTIESHLKVLQNDPMKDIYEAFLKAYWPEYPHKGGTR